MGYHGCTRTKTPRSGRYRGKRGCSGSRKIFPSPPSSTPAAAKGTYAVQVYPAEDTGNLGQGGSFFLDLSAGPLAGVAGTPNTAVHVGGLAGSPTGAKNGWKATVTITLHDASHSLLTSNATVTGAWSGGYSGNSSCSTATGQCSVTSGNIPKGKSSTKFTVTNVSGSFTYQAGSNDANSVTVPKP